MNLAIRTLTAFGLLLTSPAHACTVCDSVAGRSLRAGIFDGNFFTTMAEVLSPVSALLLAAALAHLLTRRPFLQSNSRPLDTPE